MTGSNGNYIMSNGITHMNNWRDRQLPSDHLENVAHNTSDHTTDSGNTNEEETEMIEERHKTTNHLDISEIRTMS